MSIRFIDYIRRSTNSPSIKELESEKKNVEDKQVIEDSEQFLSNVESIKTTITDSLSPEEMTHISSAFANGLDTLIDIGFEKAGYTTLKTSPENLLRLTGAFSKALKQFDYEVKPWQYLIIIVILTYFPKIRKAKKKVVDNIPAKDKETSFEKETETVIQTNIKANKDSEINVL